MARFFVSYSRSDKETVRELIELLRSSRHEVWWDEDIPPQSDWWASILNGIEWCEVFLFMVSDGSTKSDYCIAELRYAIECDLPILPVFLDNPEQLVLPSELQREQWLIYDGNFSNVLKSINLAYENIDWDLYTPIRAQRPPEPNSGEASLPERYQHARRLANDMQYKEAKSILLNIRKIDKEEWGEECNEWLQRLKQYPRIVILAKDTSTIERARTKWDKYVTRFGDEFDPANLAEILNPKIELRPEPAEPIVTQTDEIIKTPAKPIKKTSKSNFTNGVIIPAGVIGFIALVGFFAFNSGLFSSGKSDVSETPIIPIEINNNSQSNNNGAGPAGIEINNSSTQLQPTNTDIPPSPTTFVETSPTTTTEPNIINNNHSTDFVTSNNLWTPIEETFNSVEMVYVPLGCFEMGSRDADADANEQPTVEVCIENPFWIDKYEVTNEQFQRFGGVYTNNSTTVEPNYPRNNISWYEANDYCQLRDARLPTEAEWEYAASGPDNLIYPWGNEPTEANLVFRNNSNGVAPVGSVATTSWVGAYDMAGNVAEWTSTVYSYESEGQGEQIFTYPYSQTDARNTIPNGERIFMVLRGGNYATNIFKSRTSARDHRLILNDPHWGIRCVRDAD